MPSIAPLAGLAERVRRLSSRSDAAGTEAEISLYYRRACLAAAEERFDDALIFCSKAIALRSGHLPTRLLVAQIHDRGRGDLEAALESYRKVILLGAYGPDDPYCAAARAAIDRLARGEPVRAAGEGRAG